jgi:hypothetical protein
MTIANTANYECSFGVVEISNDPPITQTTALKLTTIAEGKKFVVNPRAALDPVGPKALLEYLHRPGFKTRWVCRI